MPNMIAAISVAGWNVRLSPTTKGVAMIKLRKKAAAESAIIRRTRSGGMAMMKFFSLSGLIAIDSNVYHDPLISNSKNLMFPYPRVHLAISIATAGPSISFAWRAKLRSG